MPIFDITGEDISRLDDEMLRTLIGRLSEADLRRRGQSPVHVSWGGNQNAVDGGIDVRVSLPAQSFTAGFIPRVASGFQVKKQDMPRAAIIAEMRPAGSLRDSIQALADQGGAYIIVSSEGSTSDTALNKRRSAMADAIAGISNADKLAIDFYDRNRVATWVRCHEGLIPWVRSAIGRPIPGWQSFGPWAAPLSEIYLTDEHLRVHEGARTTERGISAGEGIHAIRRKLREGGHVVRLIGLSGVGKTRLVQALFDERVGTDALNPDLAIYTNMADGPEPSPIALVTQFIASATRAVLVVDNCPPDLHRRLVETCSAEKSTISVLTVEYDIRDDEPEGTEVFKLETSSPEVIQMLVHRRFPSVSQVDLRTIADFAGGNARIALAIAGTIGTRGSLAGLTDEQVFQRLFTQRQSEDEGLYLGAQVCSLLYSFEVEDITDSGELAYLSRIVGKSPQELYRNVSELQRRDLVQQRSIWRAVLPHAVANRLAAVALQNIPSTLIDSQLVEGASQRSLRSFSRRLGYLHASKEAVSVVRRWVNPGGLLADVANLNDFGRALLSNVAPVAPVDVLTALERGYQEDDSESLRKGRHYIRLLRSLAYDPALFDRCAVLMVRILVAEELTDKSEELRAFVCLFHIYLSGTHATIEQRLNTVTRLLSSESQRERDLGVRCLRAALEAAHFSSAFDFDFGARPRDFGYHPASLDEKRHWMAAVLRVVEVTAQLDHPTSTATRAEFARAFRGLWSTNCATDELEHLCRQLNGWRFWPEGWLAVRQTLGFDGQEMVVDLRKRLIVLEHALRPVNLEQQVRSVVLATDHGGDIEDYDEDETTNVHQRMERARVSAQELGKAVAGDELLVEKLLPEVVSSDGRFGRHFDFGYGLATGTSNPRHMWDCLTKAISATDATRRNFVVLRGFLRALHGQDPKLAEPILNVSVEHAVYSPHFPYLQVAVPIGERDVARLKRSLALGKAPARAYIFLAYGRATDPIPPADLHELVLTIAALENGYDVALEVLQMRLHSAEKQDIPGELKIAGQELLRRLSFAENNDREDYQLSELATKVLGGSEGAVLAQDLCARLKIAIGSFSTHAFRHDDLLQGLFRAQPIASLDGLCGGDEEELQQGIRILNEVNIRKSVIDAISTDALLRWCDVRPNARYPAIAGAVRISERSDKDGPLRWSEVAINLLKRAPDRPAVLKAFVDRFLRPGPWSGSLAASMEANAALFDELKGFPEIAGVIAGEKGRLRIAIEERKAYELANDHERYERFE